MAAAGKRAFPLRYGVPLYGFRPLTEGAPPSGGTSRSLASPPETVLEIPRELLLSREGAAVPPLPHGAVTPRWGFSWSPLRPRNRVLLRIRFIQNIATVTVVPTVPPCGRDGSLTALASYMRGAPC